jgi:hypothetical protein
MLHDMPAEWSAPDSTDFSEFFANVTPSASEAELSSIDQVASNTDDHGSQAETVDAERYSELRALAKLNSLHDELIGNRPPHRGNVFGQKGTPRCVQCRNWRTRVSHLLSPNLNRKCVYTSPEERCESCTRRNLECGEKVLGRKAEERRLNNQLVVHSRYAPYRIPILPTPDDLRFTPMEFQYLQYVQSRDEHHYGPCRTSVYDMDLYTSDLLIPNHRTAFPMSSKILRYALLAWASAWKAGRQTDQTYLYKAEYHRHTKHAFALCAYAEILYSSYVLVKLAVRFNDNAEVEITHLTGISRVKSLLDERPVGYIDDEQLCMDRVWNDLLTDFYYRNIRDKRHQTTSLLEKRVEKICDLLSVHWEKLVHNLQYGLVRGMSMKVLHDRVRAIELYFWYYLTRYVLEVSRIRPRKATVQQKANELRAVLRCMIALGEGHGLRDRFAEIIETVPIYGHHAGDRSPKDTHMSRLEKAFLSLYLWASVMIGTIPSEGGDVDGDPKIYESARLLLHLHRPWAVVENGFNHDTCSYNDARNLFLAGLILTESKFPNGIEFLFSN